jgi:D-alanyl-D-alanine carboxypeptidase/D-alanyl-D-alanine-endopeptidase (penicillin-binding protein 4)
LKNKGKSKIEETDKGIIIYLISSAIKKENSSLHFFIRNPALLASLILMEKCSDAGIVISGAPKSGKVPEGLNEISVNTELLNIIKEVNSSSNNFYAETLYETLTSLLPSNNSKDKILSFLHSKGIELKGTVIADGSGISSGNKVSASSLISVLRKISDVEKTGTGFKQTLAVAGISGTLKELYSNSVLKGSFAGKSGFMSGISSLSGYLKTKQGKNFIVSMIFNFSEKDINYYRGIERQILEEIYLKN